MPVTAEKQSPPARRRPEFNKLTVADVRKETSDATSVAFAVPPELADQYDFTHGQYLTLKATIGGEELRRPYSVCVAPGGGELRVCVKQMPHGRFSGFVNKDLKPGDTLEVMGPMGRFSAPIEPDRAKRYLFIAGGSGITPVISNIRTILASEPDAFVTLIYGNRRMRDIIFRDALGRLKNQYLTRFQLFHVLSDEIPEIDLFHGLLTQDKIADLVSRLADPATLDWAFICGPGPVMDGGRAALEALGVMPDRIRIESFGDRPVAGPASAAAEAATGEGADVDVIYRGVRTRIKVPKAGTPLLDAVHAAQIDAPFACKGGVCCTCKAKLVEGEVTMDVVYGLEPDEIDAGYILTCQSHPVTDKLVVDYDA